jgi:hypothetical protein
VRADVARLGDSDRDLLARHGRRIVGQYGDLADGFELAADFLRELVHALAALGDVEQVLFGGRRDLAFRDRPEQHADQALDRALGGAEHGRPRNPGEIEVVGFLVEPRQVLLAGASAATAAAAWRIPCVGC